MLHQTLPTSEIVIRPDRQRELDPQQVLTLKASIGTTGLLQPISINKDKQLISGHHRLEAHKQLGLQTIDTITLEVTNEDIAELFENSHRKNLHWIEYLKAVVGIHEHYLAKDPKHSRLQTGKELHLSKEEVSRIFKIHRYLDNEEITKCESLYAARMLVDNWARKEKVIKERATTREIGALNIALPPPTSLKVTADSVAGLADLPVVAAPAIAPPPKSKVKPFPFLNIDFAEWAETADPAEASFNVVHCDFPYGVNYDTSNTAHGEAKGTYDDSEEAYEVCYRALARAIERGLVEPDSYLIFWFPMSRFTKMKLDLETLGYKVGRNPIIWTKNKGTIPHPGREPKHAYESAFIAYLGDPPKILANYPDHTSCNDINSIHPSEKPQKVMTAFLRFYVDGFARVLDPTCGSGTAIIVAEQLGAHDCLGLERDEGFFKSLQKIYKVGDVKCQ